MTINFIGGGVWQTPPDNMRPDCIGVRPGFMLMYNFGLCYPFYEVKYGK